MDAPHQGFARKVELSSSPNSIHTTCTLGHPLKGESLSTASPFHHSPFKDKGWPATVQYSCQQVSGHGDILKVQKVYLAQQSKNIGESRPLPAQALPTNIIAKGRATWGGLEHLVEMLARYNVSFLSGEIVKEENLSSFYMSRGATDKSLQTRQSHQLRCPAMRTTDGWLKGIKVHVPWNFLLLA